MIKKNDEICPVSEALKIIGGKWRLQIIHRIGLDVRRFGALKRSVDGISEKMLIQELKHLVNFGMIQRKAYKEIPPKVEYRLTEKGKSILPIIEIIKAFGNKLIESDQWRNTK